MLEHLFFMKEKVHPLRNKINELVRESFGFGFKGDYQTLASITDGPDVIRGKHVGLIFRSRIYKSIIAGEFTSLEGNSLRVFPKYIELAKRYAELYKKEIGKEVTIDLITSESFNQTLPAYLN